MKFLAKVNIEVDVEIEAETRNGAVNILENAVNRGEFDGWTGPGDPYIEFLSWQVVDSVVGA